MQDAPDQLDKKSALIPQTAWLACDFTTHRPLYCAPHLDRVKDRNASGDKIDKIKSKD